MTKRDDHGKKVRGCKLKYLKILKKFLGNKKGQKQLVDIILNYDVRERFEGDGGIINIGSEKFKIVRCCF